jgi:hypothetical protein
MCASEHSCLLLLPPPPLFTPVAQQKLRSNCSTYRSPTHQLASFSTSPASVGSPTALESAADGPKQKHNNNSRRQRLDLSLSRAPQPIERPSPQCDRPQRDADGRRARGSTRRPAIGPELLPPGARCRACACAVGGGGDDEDGWRRRNNATPPRHPLPPATAAHSSCRASSYRDDRRRPHNSSNNQNNMVHPPTTNARRPLLCAGGGRRLRLGQDL